MKWKCFIISVANRNLKNLLKKSFLYMSCLDINTLRSNLWMIFKVKLKTCLFPGCISLFSDFVKMLLTRTTRQRSVWTLRWSALRCWGFLSAYSCKCDGPVNCHGVHTVQQSIWGDVAYQSLSMLQVGHCRTREVQMYCIYILQRSPGWVICVFRVLKIKKLWKHQYSTDATFSFPPVVIIVFDVNDVASLDHVRWADPPWADFLLGDCLSRL